MISAMRHYWRVATVHPMTPEFVVWQSRVYRPAKMKRYGSDFLQVIREHNAEQQGNRSNSRPPKMLNDSNDVYNLLIQSATRRKLPDRSDPRRYASDCTSIATS